MKMCVYIVITNHEYCMLRIHMCDCVFLCSLLKSSGVGTEFIQLCMIEWFGWKGFGTPMYMVPTLWNSKFWIWIFWKPSKIQHPIFIQVPLFECNKGGFNMASIMPYMVHPSMLNLRCIFGTLFGHKQSKWQQLWSENKSTSMIFRKIWSARFYQTNPRDTHHYPRENVVQTWIWNVTCVWGYKYILIFMNNRRLGKKHVKPAAHSILKLCFYLVFAQTPNQLLNCLSFSRENGHPLTLFSCSSLSLPASRWIHFILLFPPCGKCPTAHGANLPKFLFHICSSHCSGRPSRTSRCAKPRVFYGQSNLSKLAVGGWGVYPLNLGAKILKNLCSQFWVVIWLSYLKIQGILFVPSTWAVSQLDLQKVMVSRFKWFQ